MAELAREDRLLLSLLQDHFPLALVPFTDLAERLGWTESAVIERIATLKEHGPLRQIGAILDTRRLGYASTLVALVVQPERLDEVAARVSRHPGVSHNYGRAHEFNLWFTLAVPPRRGLAREVQALTMQPGVRQVLALPTLRTFKIDVRFDLGEGPASGVGNVGRATAEEQLATEDIPYVRALQDDLPLVQRPFRLLAARQGVDEAELLKAGKRFLASGIMRRYGATLRHRQAGYPANAMVCWQLPPACIAQAGEAAAAHSAVSHCYERPACPPSWPYQLFTMVHAHSPEELAATVAELGERIRPEGMAVLPTVKEYKKVRLRYFEEGEWQDNEKF